MVSIYSITWLIQSYVSRILVLFEIFTNITNVKFEWGPIHVQRLHKIWQEAKQVLK